MGVFGLIILIVIIAAGIALLVDRITQPGAKKVDPTAAPSGTVEPAKRGFFFGWFSRGSQVNVGQQFQTWATGNFSDPALRAWIGILSKEQIAALTEQLSLFCTNLGFELIWLADGQIGKDPALEPAVKEVVESYCRACWRATQVQGDLELLKILMAIETGPFSKEQQALSQKLFAELVKQGMAPPVSPELFVAPEKERQAVMMEAIRTAADTNRTAFNQVLKAVITMEATPAAPAAEEAPAQKPFQLPSITLPSITLPWSRKQSAEEAAAPLAEGTAPEPVVAEVEPGPA